MKHGTCLQGCPSLAGTGRGRVARTEVGLNRGGELVFATGEGSKVAPWYKVRARTPAGLFSLVD